MKKLFLLMTGVILLFVITFVSCKKENAVNPAKNQVATTPNWVEKVSTASKKLYSSTNNDGTTNWMCLNPADDCTVVHFIPTHSTNDQKSALHTAITNGTVATFFATKSNWDVLLPNLVDQTDWLTLLTNGTVTLVEKKSNNLGEYLYIAALPTVPADSLKVSDAKFAIDITEIQ